MPLCRDSNNSPVVNNQHNFFVLRDFTKGKKGEWRDETNNEIQGEKIRKRDTGRWIDRQTK